MPYLNRIEVMGNLGKDPELRYLPNQTPVTSISVAYTEKWRDKTNNEPRVSNGLPLCCTANRRKRFAVI